MLEMRFTMPLQNAGRATRDATFIAAMDLRVKWQSSAGLSVVGLVSDWRRFFDGIVFQVFVFGRIKAKEEWISFENI